jgi:hypothetical protein
MAYMTLEGELFGKIHHFSADESFSMQQAIQELKGRLQEMYDKKEIRVGIILYHPPGVDAKTEAFSLLATSSLYDARCLVVSLDHISGDSLYLMIPYALNAGGVKYDKGTLVKKVAVLSGM